MYIFKPGNRVRCVDASDVNGMPLVVGEIYTVESTLRSDEIVILVEQKRSAREANHGYGAFRFVPVTLPKNYKGLPTRSNV